MLLKLQTMFPINIIHVTEEEHLLNHQTLPTMYNATTMAVKLKKVASKLLIKETRHTGRWSLGDHASHVRQGTHGHVST